MNVEQETLIKKNMYLVRMLARKHKVPLPWTSEDLVSAGFEGLCKAATRWESGRGANFATFASHHIVGSFRDEIRTLRFGSRTQFVTEPCHLREAMYDTELFLIEDDHSDVEVQDLMTKLPERERRILEMRMAGVGGDEIGAALGVSASRVTQIVKDSLRKMIKAAA